MKEFGIGLVFRGAAEGLGADEVVGLAEHRAAAGAGHRRAFAGAASAANQLHLVALAEVQRRVVGRGDTADVLERHRHVLAADVELDAAVVVDQAVGEAELEGQVLLGVAVVVDVDFVQRVGSRAK